MVTNKEIADYYDFSKLDYQLYSGSRTDIAMRYGLWDATTRTHKQALVNENRVLADIARITSSDWVIDLGCGYGFGSIWLARERGCHVIGITLSKKQVDFAKAIAERRGVANLTEFVVGDFNQMSFSDSSFSAAVATESISHSEDKLRTLKEIHRVLRRGGRLIMADGFFKKDPLALTEKERVIAQKCFEGVHVPPVAKREDIERYLKETGFRNITFYDKTAAILPTARYVHRLGKFFYPLSRLLGWLKIRTLQTSHMEAFINQYYAFHDGIGVYGIFYGEK